MPDLFTAMSRKSTAEENIPAVLLSLQNTAIGVRLKISIGWLPSSAFASSSGGAV